MAGSQLVNILKTPGYNAQDPFPEITTASPCPQFMLMSGTISGAYTISNLITQGPSTGATAACAVTVEFWSGNQKRSVQIWTSQSLSTIQSNT